MSSRASRRSQAALADAPAAPMAELRARKWTRQLRTVGHLTLWKWVPDQEAPTEALQKGAFKKTKGRKRQQPIEVGRMTRSVRQHLDAPLELLNEYPVFRQTPSKHSSTTTSPAPHTAATTGIHATKQPLHPHAPAAAPVEAATVSAAASTQGSTPPALPAAEPAVSVTAPAAASTAGTAAAAPAGPGAMGMMPIDAGNMLPGMVPSDEQLEMALDDLPLLDAEEDLFNAPFLTASTPLVPPNPAHQAPEPVGPEPSSSNPATAHQRDDNNTGDDDSTASGTEEDDGSANSGAGSPLPSPSPATSPMPSRSPSP